MVKHLKILFLLFGVLILSGCKFDADREYKVIHMLNKASESQMTLGEATEFVEKFMPEIAEHTYNYPSTEVTDIEKLMVFTEKEIEQAYIASEVLSGEMLEYESKNQKIPQELKIQYNILKKQISIDGEYFLLVRKAGAGTINQSMDNLLKEYFILHNKGTNGLQYEYNEYTGGLNVISYSGEDKDIVIPDEIKGFKVKYISSNVFQDEGITSLKLGKNIEKIDRYAFSGNKLKTLTLGPNVHTIEDYAFRDNEITNIHFGDSVTKIGDWTFADNKMTTVTFSPKIKELDIGMDAFENNAISEVVLPNVTTFTKEWSNGASKEPYKAFDDTVKYSWYE